MLKRSWIGIILIVVGIGFLLQQLGMIEFTSLLKTWWPIIFILFGIAIFMERSLSAILTGLLFIIVGSILILNQWIDINLISLIFPLILIVIGLAFILSKGQKKVHVNDDIESFCLFSSTEVKSQSTNFQNGSVTAIFGGSEIDLRDAIIADGANMEITIIFGGVNIIVPDNVMIEIRGVPIFGGWDDKTRNYVENGDVPLLKINCLSVFGGLEVKN